MSVSFDLKAFFAGRDAPRATFLNNALGSGWHVEPVGEDWASRRYLRVTDKDGKSHILMESVPDHIPTATMGHKLSAFLKIARALREQGIHTPGIMASDEQEGFILLEDFGKESVHAAIVSGGDQEILYGKATDVLIAMRDKIPLHNDLNLPKYKDSYIRKGRQRIVDWYIPATRGEKNQDDLLPGYLAVWDAVADSLPPPRIGFIHGDYHTQNLMLLKNGDVGVLDFQDAMMGPVGYDLANLLENIREDISPDIKSSMMKRYGGDDGFWAWYRVMATQFHCRILGQVIRLAVIGGKPGYLKYIPRVQAYIVNGLKDPVLAPLAQWMRAEKVDLTIQDGFDPERIRAFIRPDAF